MMKPDTAKRSYEKPTLLKTPVKLQATTGMPTKVTGPPA
jgi:hypothetical protein